MYMYVKCWTGLHAKLYYLFILGFNESFKRKLEGVLSGPLSPGGQRHVEHEYEELPIKPDAVTYADELED